MKPVANLSLDLDNKWAYLRSAGNPDWAQSRGYFDITIPRIVEMLGSHNLPLTIFVVGRDLETAEDVEAINGFKTLREHEFANHSYNHLPWLHTMSAEEIEQEIDRTTGLIESELGHQVFGFRGPGFSCPEEVLSVLSSRGFRYDASTFPTSIAPIARMAFMMRANLDEEQRKRASQLYGGWKSAFKPNKPYPRSVNDSPLWELPVTVMPFTRTPIHFSYFMFLAGYSKSIAKSYFSTAIRLCQLTGTSPSLLLHPPDFLGSEDDAEMAFFPGMKLKRAEKLSLMDWALRRLATCFDVKRMVDHVTKLDGVNEQVPCRLRESGTV
jgi:peptidoglycan-N-acetylglucosamine deacetylase